jgi:hypothetical protein
VKKQRYIVEEVPEGQLGNVHKILNGEWHGHWIDENTLFLYADCDVFELDALEARPEVTILESVQDPTPIHDQLDAKGKAKHKKAFEKHGIGNRDTVAQTGLRLAKKFGNRHLEPR